MFALLRSHDYATGVRDYATGNRAFHLFILPRVVPGHLDISDTLEILQNREQII